MKWTVFDDTTLEVHPAFFVLCAAMVSMGQGMLLVAMLCALIPHELGHVLAAGALGVRVSSIECTPFGGAARLEGWHQLSPGQAAVIALAGPMTNLLLVLCAAGVAHYGGAQGEWLNAFVRCNLVLMCFNLLPAFPMDGGRLVAAWLAQRAGEQAARRVLAASGCALGLALVGLGVYGGIHGLWNPTLFLAGSYLAFAALKERNAPTYTQLHRIFSAREQLGRRGALPSRQWVAQGDVPIERLVARLDARHYHEIRVLDEAMRPIGVLDEAALLGALLDRPGALVRDLLRS